MKRIRTIKDAFRDIKAEDPGSSITEYAIRYMVQTGRVPSIKRGAKYWINMDDLEAYFDAERRNSIESYFEMIRQNTGEGARG